MGSRGSTNVLTATGQFDRGQLLLVVLPEGRLRGVEDLRVIRRECFDICIAVRFDGGVGDWSISSTCYYICKLGD